MRCYATRPSAPASSSISVPPCCVKLCVHAYSEARPGDLIHGEVMDGAQISGNRTSARSPSGCRAADCASYPLRGLRGPGQCWGCSHAVIKDHPPRRYRRLEQPPCSGGPAHKDPDRAGTRNPRDYRVPDPVSIQLAAGVDDLGYRFGYRLGRDPRRYPRLFCRVECSAHDLAAAPGRWPGFLPAAPVGFAGVRGGTAAGGSDRPAARVVGAVRDGPS